MKKKRLLIINVALNWGSTGKIVEGVGKLALSNGWEVYVAHGARYQNASELKSIQVSSKFEEMLHYVESTLFDAQGLGSRCATKRFLKKLDDIRPDLVHIHNIHGCFINYPLLFEHFREHHIPVVWTLHDCWSMTGHCVYFERSECNKWKTECCECSQKKDFPTSLFIDRSRCNYKLKKNLFTSMEDMQITTVSSWLKGVVEESYLGKFPITVVPNGIKTASFKPTECNIRKRYNLVSKKILLGVATGFEERKGIKDYVQLASKLPSDYKLVLVGVSKYDKQLLPKSVISIDRANGTGELAGFYSSADALLSLSYEETFGLTIIEAMACGTPAVVYDNTAQPELITPETGKVVPTGDVDAVLSAIEEVCSKPKKTYSEACRKHSLEYDEKVSYQKYLDIYSAILNK